MLDANPMQPTAIAPESAATHPALTPEPPPARSRIRARSVRCRVGGCRRCPHGPYYYLVWYEAGRKRERYIGKLAPGWRLMTQPYRISASPPNLGHHVYLATPEPWGTIIGKGKDAWHSVVSAFRVDGHGLAALDTKDRSAVVPWVSLRTMDGRQVYRKARTGRRPDPDGYMPPGDPRWPVERIWPLERVHPAD